MNSHFTKSFFTQNRRSLKQRVGTESIVVLSANGLLQRSADTAYRFHQDSNFWYLTGIDEPDAILVLSEKDDYIIMPGISTTKAVFDGAPDMSTIASRSGITHILDAKIGWNQLKTDIVRAKQIYSTTPYQLRDSRSGVYANPAQRRLMTKIRKLSGDSTIQSVGPMLAALRMYKQPEELAAISKAVAITTATLDTVRNSDAAQLYTHEYVIEAAVTQGFRSRGADGHAYEPIVASGAHATTLHYVANTGPIHKQQFIVADVGAEVEHYAADITRTFTLGAPTARLLAVYAAVQEIQSTAVAMLRPGLHLRDFEQDVARMMGRALHNLGLIDNPTDGAAIRKYYPHATSHFVGLDVHDAGDYGLPLQENVVLTCEPGIYIPEEGIGVRIEDDIVITAEGNLNLSGNCSYEPSIA